MVDGRADGAVFLNSDNDSILPYPDCIYPMSSYIKKMVDGCKDVWRFQIPWASAKKCLWVIDSTTLTDYLIYKGQVVIHSMEWISLEQWRIIRSVLRVKLRFQRTITLASPNVSIFNKIVQKSAITKQIVALTLGDPALIELGTLVGWPYKLYNFTLTLSPFSKIQSVDYSKSDCVSQIGTNCRQYFRTNLHLTDGTCTLDGNYQLAFVLGCGEDVAASNCPLNASDTSASVSYSLQSENFCAEVSVDVGILGNVRSYENTTLDGSPAKNSFIVGRRVYYLVKVNSDINVPSDPDQYNPTATGTVMTFASVQVVNVKIKPQDVTLQPVIIFQNGSAVNFTALGQTDYGTLCQTQTTKNINGVDTPLQGNQIALSFIFTRAIAYNLAQNSQVSYTVVIDVQVTYTNATKKRFSLQTTGTDSGESFETDNDVVDNGSGPTDTNVQTAFTDTTVPAPTSLPPTTAPTPGPITTHGSNSSITLFTSLIVILIALLI